MDNDIRIGFRLKHGRDDQIIEWLESIGDTDKSYYIREGLRHYVNALMSQAPSPSLPLSSSASKQVSSAEKKDFAEEAEPVEQTDIKDNILALFD
jgi:hypothetical protein